MLKQSEQQSLFYNDDRQQISGARKEAEALFRPKPKLIEPSALPGPSKADASVRKPRILSASAPPLDRQADEIPIRSKPQIAMSVSQFASTCREQLNRARMVIFRRQRELQEKLDAIENEMRAIDAYKSAKKGETSSGRCDRRRV